MKIFVMKNKQTMFAILQQLVEKARLIMNKDCGEVNEPAHLHVSRGTKMWITASKVNLPLVRKVLIENRMLK